MSGWLGNIAGGQWQGSWYWPTPPYVYRFCGSRRTIAELPNDAIIGDAYLISEGVDLVVRVVNGWHTFDKPQPESAP